MKVDPGMISRGLYIPAERGCENHRSAAKDPTRRRPFIASRIPLPRGVVHDRPRPRGLFLPNGEGLALKRRRFCGDKGKPPKKREANTVNVSADLNASQTIPLVLSWLVLPVCLLAMFPFTTPGKKAMQRWLYRREVRATRRVALSVLMVVWALIAFFPLGGYRLLPTRWQNCFVQGGRVGVGWLGGEVDHNAFPGGTPCGHLSGEQRTL